MCSFVRAYVRSSVHLLAYPFVRLFVLPFVHSSIRSFVHSLIHPFVRDLYSGFIRSNPFFKGLIIRSVVPRGAVRVHTPRFRYVYRHVSRRVHGRHDEGGSRVPHRCVCHGCLFRAITSYRPFVAAKEEILVYRHMWQWARVDMCIDTCAVMLLSQEVHATHRHVHRYAHRHVHRHVRIDMPIDMFV